MPPDWQHSRPSKNDDSSPTQSSRKDFELTHSNSGNNKSPNQQANPFEPPSINLPKGGGAIKGIGEKFTANPVTGTGSMTIPIATSLGRSGFGPQLSLSYDSGSGNGPFGLGWNLSMPSITRKTDKGLPKYQDDIESDVFILSGSEDLVPVSTKNGENWNKEEVDDRIIGDNTYEITRYRPRTEGLFARIEKWINVDDQKNVLWRSISKDNITTWYGKTENSRIQNNENGICRIFSWLISESYDDKGNAIVYEYQKENLNKIDLNCYNEKNRTDEYRNTNRYIKRIKYGNKTSRLIQPDLAQTAWMFEVVFDYSDGHYEIVPFDENIPEEEQHQFVKTNISGSYNNIDIQEYLRKDPFSSYRAGFEVRTYCLCRRVLMFHHFKDKLGVEDYLVRSTEFLYNESPIASFIQSVTQSGYKHVANDKYLKKSLPPVEFKYSESKISSEIKNLQPDSYENLPIGVDGRQFQFVDLDGEGLSGILSEQGDGWYYKPNLGEGKFGALQTVATKPSPGSLSGGQQLLDLAGDGQLDLVSFQEPLQGFFERTDNKDWESFKPFKSIPNINWNDPNLKFVDLNGDGHADIFITEDEVFRWHPSLAEDGFAESLHISYTSEFDSIFKTAIEDLNGQQENSIKTILSEDGAPLHRIFSLKYDFSQTYRSLMTEDIGSETEIEIKSTHFPFFFNGMGLKAKTVELFIQSDIDKPSGGLKIKFDDKEFSGFTKKDNLYKANRSDVLSDSVIAKKKISVTKAGNFNLAGSSTIIDQEKIDDIFILVNYKLQ